MQEQLQPYKQYIDGNFINPFYSKNFLILQLELRQYPHRI